MVETAAQAKKNPLFDDDSDEEEFDPNKNNKPDEDKADESKPDDTN